MQAKIFKAVEENNPWLPIIDSLEENGYDVYPTTEQTDKAIILSGKFENPTVFSCKKVLIYHRKEWIHVWEFFEPIVEEYYDEMIDVTELSLRKTVETIIDEVKKP